MTKQKPALRPHENWWTQRPPSMYEQFLQYERQLSHPVRQRVAEEAKSIGGRVLDVGCASCIDYEWITQAGLSYTGVDGTNEFLDVARTSNVHWANARELPFSDDSFETVYCKDLLEHQPPTMDGSRGYELIVRELWRVTGTLMILVCGLAPGNATRVLRHIPCQRGQELWLVLWEREEMKNFLSSLPNVRSIHYDSCPGMDCDGLSVKHEDVCLPILKKGTMSYYEGGFWKVYKQ